MLSQHRNITSKISSFMRSSRGTKWSLYGFPMLCITLIVLFCTLQEISFRRRLATVAVEAWTQAMESLPELKISPELRVEHNYNKSKHSNVALEGFYERYSAAGLKQLLTDSIDFSAYKQIGNFNVNLMKGEVIANRLQFPDTTNLYSFITFMKNVLKMEGEDYVNVAPAEKTRMIKTPLVCTREDFPYVAYYYHTVQETVVRLTAADLEDILGDKVLSAYTQMGNMEVHLLKRDGIAHRLQFWDTGSIKTVITFMKNDLKMEGKDCRYMDSSEQYCTECDAGARQDPYGNYYKCSECGNKGRHRGGAYWRKVREQNRSN